MPGTRDTSVVSRSRCKCSGTQQPPRSHAFDRDRRPASGQDVAVLGGTGHPGRRSRLVTSLGRPNDAGYRCNDRLCR